MSGFWPNFWFGFGAASVSSIGTWFLQAAVRRRLRRKGAR